MTWKPISTVPLNTPVLVTDGQICTVLERYRVPATERHPEIYGWSEFGITGYEYEIDIEPTHWTELPSIEGLAPPVIDAKPVQEYPEWMLGSPGPGKTARIDLDDFRHIMPEEISGYPTIKKARKG